MALLLLLCSCVIMMIVRSAATPARFMALRILQLRIYILLWKVPSCACSHLNSRAHDIKFRWLQLSRYLLRQETQQVPFSILPETLCAGCGKVKIPTKLVSSANLISFHFVINFWCCCVARETKNMLIQRQKRAWKLNVFQGCGSHWISLKVIVLMPRCLREFKLPLRAPHMTPFSGSDWRRHTADAKISFMCLHKKQICSTMRQQAKWVYCGVAVLKHIAPRDLFSSTFARQNLVALFEDSCKVHLVKWELFLPSVQVTAELFHQQLLMEISRFVGEFNNIYCARELFFSWGKQRNRKKGGCWNIKSTANSWAYGGTEENESSWKEVSCQKLFRERFRIWQYREKQVAFHRKAHRSERAAQFMNNFLFAFCFAIHSKWFIKYSTEDNKVNVLKDASPPTVNPSVHSTFNFNRFRRAIPYRVELLLFH